MVYYWGHKDLRAVVPFVINIEELSDYLSYENFDSVASITDKLNVAVEVKREPEDKDCGIPVSYFVSDWSVDLSDEKYILFRDIITTAIDEYLECNEETLMSDVRVKDTFDDILGYYNR